MFTRKYKELNIGYIGPSLSGRIASMKYICQVLKKEFKSPILIEWPIENPSYRIGLLRFKILNWLWFPSPEAAYKDYRAQIEIDFLKVVDGLIFVADSQNVRLDANIMEYYIYLRYLQFAKKTPEDLPIVFQLNKRDLPDIASVEELKEHLHRSNCAYIETVAYKGIGVIASLNKLIALIDNK